MSQRRAQRRVILISAALIAASFSNANAQDTCSGTDAAWPGYSGPGLGARHQDDTTITPANAGSLATKWVVNTSVVGGGEIQSTPILAGGCVIITTNTGVIAAFSPSGTKVWSYKANTTGGNGLGGVIVGSVAVTQGMVVAGISQRTTPYVLGLDLTDGSVEWETTVDNHPGNFISASPVTAGDLVFVGVSGDEYGATSRGGYAFLDPTDGSLEAFRYTITDAEYAAGYRGSSVWASGSYVDGFIYVGAGNPAAKTLEHRYSNSLIKIDARPTSTTFATITDAYKGNVDQYYPGIDRQPACEEFGEDQPNLPQYPWSLACVQFDIDFGASPNLWYNEAGDLMMGALQKSGVYHAVLADNMQLAWSTIVPGAPCFPCNASSSATDSKLVFAAGSPGSTLTAFTAEAGKYRWALPLADGLHFQSVTSAGGVVYTVASNGLLYAVDAISGTPLSIKSFRLEANSNGSALSSAGISVAGDTVYAPNGSVLMALSPTI